MKGAIEYLKTVREYCEKYQGDCKRCPLGEEPKITDNLCPRVIHPRLWDDKLINAMVRIGKAK